MKKVFLGLLSLLLVSTSLFAQEDPAKALKKASRAFSAYKIDPAANAEKFEEAKKMFDIALADSEVASSSKGWQQKGDMYSMALANEFAEQQKAQLMGSTYELKNLDAALIAHEAYMMASKNAAKKYETKDAVQGMSDNIGNMQNVGITLFKGDKAAEAFKNFKASLEAHEAVEEAGMESPLKDQEAVNNAIYLTGYSALVAGQDEDAKPYYDKLYEASYDEATVYEGIYKLYKDTDIEKALGALEAGLAKFPDNQSLSYAQINYYIAEGKLSELVDKLKAAIAKDPDNVSLYSVLGNTYDNLSTKETEAGNAEKAQEYFDSAMTYYEQALAKEPKNTDAIYSIGTLYYNKAATKTQALKDLDGCYTKKCLAEFDAIQAEMIGLFDKALPYFQDVEKMNPKDRNTLIALKEIYAKKNDITTSNEFKNRLDNIDAIEGSYFKNN